MMLDTWDGKIFYPRFYDMDTICSFNNSGVITFDTDIEMEQGYWNTSSSRLWTRIRDLFHSELVEIYKDMRQNGYNYEKLMHYFYDEQIARIPETYYNKDYDVKYAPYADEYMGMANGSAYEHLKRWLKRRILFTDSLYDYVPSYADSITIRANTTEEMRIEIETYAPVYQHMSWYNNQMDKKKIDGKTAVVFTGKAQASTDQEVLIYGGSNIKRIRGLSTMNPDSMVIGNASKLVELECSNAPLLTDINQNKANLSPNKYLTKVDISNCPLLGGTLRLNNSPLLSEVNAHGTAITGMILPTSIKNLGTLRVPKGVTELTLNDAKTLTTLDLEEGYLLETLSLSNCNKLKSFDLSKVTNITLDNSYVAEELRLSTNQTVNLKNMSILERLVYTPNSEQEDFDLTTLKASGDYTVTTFNCPKLKEFITTAPQRISYGESDDVIYPYKLFMANKLDLRGTQVDTVKFLCTTDVFDLKLPNTVKNFYCDSVFDLNTSKITDGSYDTVHSDLIQPYTEEYKYPVVFPNMYENVTESYKILNTDGKYASNWILVKSDSDVVTNFNANGWYGLEGRTSAGEIRTLYYATSSGDLTVNNQHIPSDIVFIRYTSAIGTVAFDLTYEKPYTPNIIPTSANGSLLFNINQDTPEQNAPYIWDLQGMKLNDFHTYGVNNKVDVETIIHKVKTKIINNWICADYIGGAPSNNRRALQPFHFPDDVTSIHITSDKRVAFSIQREEDGATDGCGSYITNTTVNLIQKEGYATYKTIQIALIDVDVSWIKLECNNGKVYIIEPLELDLIEVSSSNEAKALKTDIDNIVDNVLGDLTSIQMPKRLPDYKVQIKNADITPNQYNTMLYPKLVDTTLPITGKLDYSKYKGKYLSWAFAYTTDAVARTPLDSRSQGQIINDYNKLYGTDFVDIVDVWAYKDDDFSNRATNNNITKAYIELTQDNYKTRIDEVLQWYPNCTELYLFDDGSVTSLENMFGSNNVNTRNQIINITFMEDYFENTTKMYHALGNCNNLKTSNLPNNAIEIHACFQGCKKLEKVINIPITVNYMLSTFNGCNKLNQQFDLSQLNIQIDGLQNVFFNCSSLTYTPILPTNYTGSLNGAFQGTKITTAPVLPNGGTSLYIAFKDCSELTTVGNIPTSCNNFQQAFSGCSKLTSVPQEGWNGEMRGCFYNCSLLNQKIIIDSCVWLANTFERCSSLTVTPTLPTKVDGSMERCFSGCTSLVIPPITPEGVIRMQETYNNCTSLASAPNIPDSVTNIVGLVYNCNNLTEITIPLENITAYTNALYGTGIQKVNWVGKRKTNFDIQSNGLYGGYIGTMEYEQGTIKSLVNDHLDDLYKDKIKISFGDNKITVNDTETTITT